MPISSRGLPKKSRKNNRYRTGSFWLNNNNLKNVNGLRNLAERLLDMADYLSWLDLSGNNLTIISGEFLLFPNLSMLYLHKNNIKDSLEAYKLGKLSKLRALTLHNNPMCTEPEYRCTIVHMLPSLQKFDNVVVLKSEREKRSPIDKGFKKRLSNAYPNDFPGAAVARLHASPESQ